MDFKQLLAMSLLLLSAVACSPVDKTKDDTNIIGVHLEKVSSLTKADGSESAQVAVFDERTRRIHQFKLSDMTFIRSYQVPNPDGRHVVLVHEDGNYVIDLCEKQLNIYSRNGAVEHNPIVIEGQPISAAFRSSQNMLIIYDDMANVYFLQLTIEGQKLKTWSGGSRIDKDRSIVSGDLLESGKLVLGLTDRSLAVVDAAQTVTQKKWVYNAFATNLSSDLGWIAPVSDNPAQVFVKAGSELAIFNVETKTLVSSGNIPGGSIEKLSKVSDGHIVIRSDTQADRLDVIYAHDSQLHATTLQKQEGTLASSSLDANAGLWTFIEIPVQNSPPSLTSNDNDYTKYGRTLKRFDLATMGTKRKMTVVDQAQVLISPSAIFALFPSDYGKAVRYDIETGLEKKAEFFNAAGN